MFDIDIFNENYKIDCKYYKQLNSIDYLYRLRGNAIIKEHIIYLDLLDKNSKYFENIITHEILHIFQYNKNKIDYLSYGKYKNLYIILNDLLLKNDYENNLNDIDLLFINAAYISFPFEQDAMIHGLYKHLIDKKITNIFSSLKTTDEYLYLEDLKNSIEKIDLFNESLFNNIITKNAFLKLLKKSKNRYETKINKIMQKAYNDKKVNESIGLIHYTHHKI